MILALFAIIISPSVVLILMSSYFLALMKGGRVFSQQYVLACSSHFLSCAIKAYWTLIRSAAPYLFSTFGSRALLTCLSVTNLRQ